MSLSIKTDNKKKDILILGLRPTQGLREHSLSVEKIYSINFTKINTKFCLSLHIMEQTVTCFLMVQKFINLQQKILRLLQIICAWEMFQKILQQVT